jgi:ABC-type phosphate/phosphonate transport system substrate-binding protein
MSWIALLPMYDFPEVAPATDTLWQALAQRLRQGGLAGVPDRLARELAYEESWRHPKLLLGQSCGYPAMGGFKASIRIIATPIYGADGCDGPTHRSLFVVPRASPATQLAELRGGRFALNGRGSNTGMNLPRLAIAALAGGSRFFSAVTETGSHAASLAAVASGAADLAAIDCVTHALLARHRPGLVAATRVIARTAGSPALPFVTAHAADGATVAALRAALAAVAADPALASCRRALLLNGVVPASAADYAIVLDIADEATRLGYPELA